MLNIYILDNSIIRMCIILCHGSCYLLIVFELCMLFCSSDMNNDYYSFYNLVEWYVIDFV